MHLSNHNYLESKALRLTSKSWTGSAGIVARLRIALAELPEGADDLIVARPRYALFGSRGQHLARGKQSRGPIRGAHEEVAS